MADIKITLETLYDILRNEKKREDLQKMEATFFLDVVQYLREKQALLQTKQNSTDPFAAGEKEKLEYELRSIKRILKEIYEKREKKIIEIALNRSRTGSDIIDTSALLAEEREFYQKILKTMDNFRRGVLLNLFEGKMPSLPDQLKLEQMLAEKMLAEHRSEPPITPAQKEIPTSSSELLSGRTKIKFIHPLPSFVWKDMKVYGPFDPGEEIDIYTEVAELIVRKGRAVKV